MSCSITISHEISLPAGRQVVSTMSRDVEMTNKSMWLKKYHRQELTVMENYILYIIAVTMASSPAITEAAIINQSLRMIPITELHMV
jgi:hypothetical protein